MLDRRHTFRGNDDSLVFALISLTPFNFLLFLSHTSSVLCAPDPATSSLLSANLYFIFP